MIGAQARGRTYERRVDHDAIRAQRAAGATYAELARTHGISATWAKALCEPAFAEHLAARAAERSHVLCETGCGRRTWRNAQRTKDGRVLCVQCRAIERETRVRRDASGVVLEQCCAACHEWKPAVAFPGNRSTGTGLHFVCRPCQTTTRQRRREALKIPCVRCGAPRLPRSENRTAIKRGLRDTGLCVRCYRESVSATKGTG